MVYVIQSDAEVPPGTVADELEALSAPWRLVRLDRGESLPPVSVADAVTVLGGTMSVHDEDEFPFLRELKFFIRRTVEAEVPFLGICLGGQLLAHALGALVVRKRWGELGSGTVRMTHEGERDRLFRGIAPSLPVFQWHNDSFDLPAEAVLLASSSVCPHQAFRVGAAAWGLQFHPEVTPAIIADWAAADGFDDAETGEMVSAWMRDEDAHRQTISRMMRNFVRG
jgi:GMP synthase-like glutamine amidotransferase